MLVQFFFSRALALSKHVGHVGVCRGNWSFWPCSTPFDANVSVERYVGIGERVLSSPCVYVDLTGDVC